MEGLSRHLARSCRPRVLQSVEIAVDSHHGSYLLLRAEAALREEMQRLADATSAKA